jgi:hypothetical protein
MVQAIIREAKKELKKLNQLQGYKGERERRPQIEIDRAMSSMKRSLYSSFLSRTVFKLEITICDFKSAAEMMSVPGFTDNQASKRAI